MITVRVYRNDDEIARMRISRVHTSHEDAVVEADYVAEVAVERAGAEQAVGMHTVHVSNFPRLRFNVLALMKSVLDAMTEEDLSLDHDTLSSDFDRPLRKRLPEIISSSSSRIRRWPL